MSKELSLGMEPVGRLLLKYSIPAIIGMMANAVYNLIDRLFIGNIPDVGAYAMTGVGIALPIMTVMMAFASCIAMGAATNMSLLLGRKKREDAETVVGNAVTLSVITGAMLTGFYYMFGDRILALFGASPESLGYAKTFMDMLVIGVVPWMLSATLNTIMRADGSPKRSAVIMIIGCAVNVPLDWLFIYPLGMGIGGAALATVISQTLTMVLNLEYFLRGKSNLKFGRVSLRLKRSVIKMILAIGITPFALQLAISVSQTVTNHSLKMYGGDLAIGAMTTIMTVVLLFFMPLMGLTQGMQPIVGYNYGGKNYERARKAYFIVTAWGFGILLAGTLLMQLFPEFVISLFNKDPDLTAITVNGMRKDTITLPLAAISVIGSSYMLCIGKARPAMVLSLLRQIIVLIPTLIFLPKLLGLDGVWYAQPVGDVLSSVATVAVLFMEFRSYRKTASDL